MKSRVSQLLNFDVTDPSSKPKVGVILGTGWGEAFKNPVFSCPLRSISDFEGLADLPGHRRELLYIKIANKAVVALSGRVHLNESHDPSLPWLVRNQVELLIDSGIDYLIVTNAAGSLGRVPVNSILVVNGFLSLFAPPMPLGAGEFVSPDDSLNPKLQEKAHVAAYKLGWPCYGGGLAMVRGPFFEGRVYDKPALRSFQGVDAVGMSMLPEACVAAVYNIPVLGLSLITNSDTEEHSHEENLRRAGVQSARLGELLTEIIRTASV